MEPRSSSLAVTAKEFARIQTIAENSVSYDFGTHVDPHGSKRAQQQDSDLPWTFILRQSAPDIQWLFPTNPSDLTSYTIARSTARRRFGRKQVWMEVTRHTRNSKVSIAEFNMEDNERTSHISYTSADSTRSANMTGVGSEQVRCVIDDKAYMWQPLGPSKTVLVMTDEVGKRLALLVYPQTEAPRSGSYPGYSKTFKDHDIGTIHVMDTCDGGQGILEVMLCTGVALACRRRKSVPW